ncbi:MAG: SRPBCC family protein [Deltaproteobacteria bacterium]|nr:SRPBCC family protein [Deltaproteobacteria bacterium]
MPAARAIDSSALTDVQPLTTSATATLPVPAGAAFEALADIGAAPDWLSVLRSARVLEHDPSGRPARVAFVGRLRRASIGYTLEYSYDDEQLTIAWRSPAGASAQVNGEASFVPLSATACMISYTVSLEVPVGPWADDGFEQHPASAVVSWFREHLRSQAPRS